VPGGSRSASGFCRSFDFELQASADEDGIVLSLGPQHSFPIESLFGMLTPDNGRYLLEQALLAAPVFQTRWRWCATRSLAVLRNKNGKRVPPNLQRFRSDDLLAAVFPAQAGCLENHHGDTEIPDHPLIHQTMEDCMHEAMDIDSWVKLLGDIRTGRVELVGRETREPSPFSHEILNANPYAFLDDAPLEERRARAVQLRRGLSFESASDLADSIRKRSRKSPPKPGRSSATPKNCTTRFTAYAHCVPTKPRSGAASSSSSWRRAEQRW